MSIKEKKGLISMPAKVHSYNNQQEAVNPRAKALLVSLGG